jgi:hypothetical protein
MAIIEATPITDLQGGLIALGFAVVCLLLRAWLTSPRRRFPRIVIAPPPPVLTIDPRPSGPGQGPSRTAGGFDDEIAHALAHSRRRGPNVPSTYDGRH